MPIIKVSYSKTIVNNFSEFFFIFLKIILKNLEQRLSGISPQSDETVMVTSALYVPASIVVSFVKVATNFRSLTCSAAR